MGGGGGGGGGKYHTFTVQYLKSMVTINCLFQLCVRMTNKPVGLLVLHSG